MWDPPTFVGQMSDCQGNARQQRATVAITADSSHNLACGEDTAEGFARLGVSRHVACSSLAGAAPARAARVDPGASRGGRHLRHSGGPHVLSPAAASGGENRAARRGSVNMEVSAERTSIAPRQIAVLVPDMPPAEMVLPYLQRMDEAGWYTNFGPLVRELEVCLRDRLTSSERGPAIEVSTTSSGTMALELAMSALDLEPGTQVLVPGFNFPATATAARRQGYEPVFCDVDATAWIMTPEIARAACERFEIGLVVPVATFGRPLDVEVWDAFTAETGIPVLIDAAAAFDGQHIGRTTTVVFSCHATKPFGIGEGGLVATTRGDLARRVRRLSNFGFLDGMVRDAGGGNGKLSEYHAAVGLAQLERWEEVKQRRRRLARQYAHELALLGSRVSLQQGWGGFGPATLTVALGEAAIAGGVTDKLQTAGIETRRWYCPQLTRHPSFQRAPRASADGDSLPVSESLCQCTVGLPFHGHMTTHDVTYVCQHLGMLL